MIEIPDRIKGFNFVLLGGDDGKKPFEKAWQNKTHRIDDLMLQQHLQANKNYGVRTGATSPVIIENKSYSLVVVDFDSEDCQKEIMPKLPKTFSVKTGGKGLLHGYLATDNDKSFKIFDKDMKTLCDIQGEGKQVVAPGSINPKTNRAYEIVDDSPIAFIPYSELEAILRPYDKSPKKAVKPIKNPVIKSFNDDVASKAYDSISRDSVLNEVGVDTSKNPTACPFHHSNGGKCFLVNEDGTMHCFHCDNSWNKFSLVREAKKLTDKETFEWFAEKAGMLDQLKKARKEYAKQKEEIVVAVTPEKSYAKSEFLITHPKFGFKYPNEDKLAKYLISKYKFQTIYGKKSEEFYAFDGRIYTTEKAREIIKTECETILQEYCKSKNVTEVLEKVKRSTAVDRKIFDNIPLKYIPFDNGILNLEENKIYPYDPKYPFRFVIPVKYDITSTCPVFIKFLEETLLPEDISVLQEWFGFSLYRAYFIKKGLICNGLKDTGKTVLLKVLIRFIGQYNTCGISLQRITSEDTFALAELYCKHQNVYDDLSSKDLNNGGGFKIATGGGYITGEYKFGDNFGFLNYAKQTFACNKIPPIQDDDGAYLERWMPIPFLNQVPENEQDNFLFDKLTTENELSGILNWALQGLQRLLKNGRFSYSRTKEEVRKIMESSGNPLIQFGDDCLIEATGQKITKESMFELYTLWANKTNSPRISKEQLGRRLESSIKYIIAKVGAKERFWENVCVNYESKFLKSLDLDTIDTFKKNMRDRGINMGIDMIKINVSNPSKINNNTLDTYSKEEQDIIATHEQVVEHEKRDDHFDDDSEEEI